MILRIAIIACAIFIYPAQGKMTALDFRYFELECFFQNRPNEKFEVNGQETPLSSTLENFISLAEKFERANPGIELKEELEYFISGYLFENIKLTSKSVVQESPSRAKMELVEEFWNPPRSGSNIVDPFTPPEKCSIYYMISHSILNKYEKLKTSPRLITTGNSSASDRTGLLRELNVDYYFPQEIGVVAIRGTDAAVSLSKVLLGLYVGLKDNRKAGLSSYDRVRDFLEVVVDSKRAGDLQVDKLYSVTIADVFMQAYWDPQNDGKQKLAPNGEWVSTFLGKTDQTIEGFCPMVYKQTHFDSQATELPGYSYSSVRGAADGLILGLTIPKVMEKQQKVRLSQILRMYYSADGITVGEQIEDINDKHVSFCSRQRLMQSVRDKTNEQLLSYGFLIAELTEDVQNTYKNAIGAYDTEENSIFNNVNTEIRDYCNNRPSSNKPEDFPREPLLDIIVVLDSANEVSSFQQQQLIVGYLAKSLDLMYTGSRMTVLLDERNATVSSSSTDSGSPRILLNSILTDTYSSSCVACIVGQYVLSDDSSPLEKEDVIIALNQLLQERRESEKESNGVNGKFVIFFNFEPNVNGGNNKIQGGLESALRDFHLNNQDVAFYAVGLHKELLKKYAKNDESLTIARPDVAAEDVAREIFRKISIEPALIQYEDCREARNERAAIYEGLVSPNAIQHYELPSRYMNASRGITFTFESPNGGYIKVCHNRGTKLSEFETNNCKNTTGNAAVEFKVSSPCRNFGTISCSPVWFSVMGMNTNNGEMKPDNRIRGYCQDTKEKWCKTLDQIKFRVSHDGVRCSGCLVTPQIVVLFTTLLTYFMCKRL